MWRWINDVYLAYLLFSQDTIVICLSAMALSDWVTYVTENVYWLFLRWASTTKSWYLEVQSAIFQILDISCFYCSVEKNWKQEIFNFFSILSP